MTCNGGFLGLDHQQVYFTNRSKTIAWRGNFEGCRSFRLESVKVTPFASCTGVDRATVEIWSTNMTEVVISSEELVSGSCLLYFNLTALDNQGRICHKLLMLFQVDPLGMVTQNY